MWILSKSKSCRQLSILLILDLLALTFPLNQAHSQNIVQTLGGVDTYFTMKSNNTELHNIKQCIIKRGNFKAQFTDFQDEASGRGSYGYGYGVQMIYLEFISYAEIKTIRKKSTRKETYYEISLFDKNNNLLAHVELDKDDIKRTTNQSDIKTYSVNLNSIPMVLFDITQTIDITLIEPHQNLKS